ncbi:MAG: TerC family protein [Planctomycetales bacterium]
MTAILTPCHCGTGCSASDATGRQERAARLVLTPAPLEILTGNMVLEYIASVAQIILIDIVLSGDNAVVIAMAAHKLPAHQRQRAILWGGGIAIFLRIIFTLVMAFLLMIPGVRLVGGLVLTWIACKLLVDEEEHAVGPDDADKSALAAIRMIFVADFVMSLDNMLAVAGASHGDWMRLLLGLLVSIGIIMTCSSLIARLMNRFQWIVYLGAAILALTAGEMMLGDRELAGYIVRRHGISLNSHWERDFLFSHAHLKSFHENDLPEDLARVIEYRDGKLTYIGQMTPAERDELQARVDSEPDKKAIAELYEQSYQRPVPDWVPDALRTRAAGWFQRKWGAQDWDKMRDSRHPYVAWIFYAAVVGFCLSSPYWLRRKKDDSHNADPGSQPPTGGNAPNQET